MSIFLTLFVIKTSSLFYFKTYFVAWRFFGLNEGINLLKAHIVTYLLFIVIYYLYPDPFSPLPRSVILIDFFLSLMFLGFLRISKRIFVESASEKLNPTIIIGANNRTTHIIKGFLNRELSYYPAAIIDREKKLIGTYIANVKVYAESSLDSLIESHEITSVIITDKVPPKELDTLFEKLISLGVNDIKLSQYIGEKETKLKDVSIEDLLARKPKDLDTEVIQTFIEDKTVLITGAGGSIGSEICRQCKAFGAKKLILIDHSEYNLYSIMEEMADIDAVPVLQNVVDRKKLHHTFQTYQPNIVIHAAAYKHVPLVEANAKEGVINNILGTKNVIDEAIEANVKKFVLISTDKAVRPTNVMGATKRVCELYAGNVVSHETEIVAVRFGNVLGSSGSVIPKFKKQIEAGGPVTVTHPDITRYFMLIPEASLLVLQAASIAKGGETFILDMGEPVKIVDLAKKMLKLYQKENEVEIAFVGLRAGEKLYEELLIDESEAKTRYESIHVAKNSHYDITQLNQDIEALFNREDISEGLKAIVPEFDHKKGSVR